MLSQVVSERVICSSFHSTVSFESIPEFFEFLSKFLRSIPHLLFIQQIDLVFVFENSF